MRFDAALNKFPGRSHGKIDGRDADEDLENLEALTDEQLLALEQELMRLGEREGLPALRARRGRQQKS